MEKHITIKDIAKMAGVSVGTIDRVIHNRGRVSESSKAAIEQILAKIDYRPDIRSSSKPYRKKYRIMITMPTAVTGEYWGSIHNGILRCIKGYSDLQIDCEYSYYNQFDIYSCRSAFENIVEQALGTAVAQTLFELSDTLPITSVVHGVRWTEIANELYHILFGTINQQLVDRKLVSEPQFFPGQGRYRKCIELYE